MKKTKIKKDLFNRIKEIGSENKVRGITLISLVITIVVLIILAGVIISITLGNGGIIDKAKLAKQEYANAQGKEEKDIEEYSNQIDEYSAFTRGGGSNISYSTNEQNTGLKWIDNKPIYQRTFTDLSYSLSWESHNAIANITPLISGIDKIIYADAIATNSNNQYGYIPIHIMNRTTTWTLIGDNNVTISALTIQYTKQ